ncbi:hypothetical protein Dda_9366 [Drechslerella dactyloides]|uniref:Uncharacterized protein n=1 Tax=Drechslerella dactyloides TaxID=74499 RepID=A0AAD6NF94_DREDA|nr:hypothetical protein Dda_9366 [Drechslerella dactyloides]
MADNWTAMHNFGRKQQRSLSQGHPHHHRVQSTNMLFPSNVDPMAQLSRNGIRVAPTEARAAALAASSPFNMNVPWAQQQLMQMKAQQQQQMQRMIQVGQQVQMDTDAGVDGNINNTDNINRTNGARRASSSVLHQQQQPVMHTPEEFQRARLNARGLHAGVNLLPMFGDKPPQSSRSGSPRLGSGYGSDASSGMTPPSHYNLGFGFAETTHYSYKPDTARLRVDEDVDDSMDEWEKELFQSYRKIKYYGEEQQSKERTVEIVTKFTAAARGAWNKLEQAAESGEVSDGFRKFFAAVGSFETLTRQGFKNLDLMLDGKPPTTLIPVYSLLHVAYAISQTTSDKVPQLPKPLSVAEFSLDAQTTWKQCLKTGVNSLGFSDRLVFDELLVLMTNEIDAALEWISTRTCMTNWTYFGDSEVQDDMNACTLPPELSFTGTDTSTLWLGDSPATANNTAVVLARSSSSRQAALPPERASRNMLWDAIVEGPAFAHVIKFLDSLGHLGTMFDRLCGPPGDSLAGRQQLARLNIPPLRSFNELILNLIIGRIWKNANFTWVAHIMRAAINMVGIGAIETLRDFENYVVGISKFCEELPKRVHFLKAFVGICGKFAPAFDHRQVRAGQAPYSDDYVEIRCGELQSETRVRPNFTRPHTTPSDSITQHLINDLNVQPWDMSQNWVADGQLFQGPSFQENCQDLSSGWGRVTAAPVDYFHATAMAKGTAVVYPKNEDDDEHEYDDDEDMMGYSQLQPQVVPDNYTLFSGATGDMHPRPGHARTPSTGTANRFVFPYSNFMQDTSTNSAANFSPGTPKSNHSGKSASGHRSSPSWSMSDRSTPIRRAPRRNRPAEGREFTCDVPGCGARIRGSKYTRSNSNLLRHKRSAHPTITEAMQEYWCEEVGCTARYTGARARENLKTHMKNKHGKVTPKKTARRME